MAGHWALMNTPIGPLRVSWEAGRLTAIDLEPSPATAGDAGAVPGAFARALDAYFEDGTYRFDLPLRLAGTSFQQELWGALRAIPPGRTFTYGQLAHELRTSPRAVGRACRANPCPIVIPCHRVVGAHGLGGFAGDLSGRKLTVKRWLLGHEGAQPLPG
jgi:methylated-DNA-[protein]-cysteine S-methyltransferase